jgi:cell division transport system permease protein
MNRYWRRLKRILAPRLDIPFAKDDTNRYLPWFIALMVFLTGMFLAGGITVGEIASHKRSDISEWVSIQIPAAENTDALTDRVMRHLKAIPTMDKVNLRPRKEIAEMIAPWFGSGKSVNELPLPSLIEAKWKKDAPQNISKLKLDLKEISPLIELDDHQYWLEHYLNFIRILEWSAYSLALLIIGATTLMIIFTSKTALRLHEDAVTLLHSVGAVDDYIARQFQFNAFLLGMRGALMGTAVSALLFFLIGFFTKQFQAPLLPSIPITVMHVVVWLLLPIVTGFLSMLVARNTVLRMLRQMA